MKIHSVFPDSSQRPSVRRAALLFLLLFIPACGGNPDGGITVEDPWARAMPLFAGQGEVATNSAVYLLLRNRGDSLVQLVGGRSTAAAAVELHESRMVDGAMTMRPLEALPLPPDSSVALRPGGVHLMLVGLVRSLEEGDTLDLILEFRGAPDLSVSVPIRWAGIG